LPKPNHSHPVDRNLLIINTVQLGFRMTSSTLGYKLAKGFALDIPPIPGIGVHP